MAGKETAASPKAEVNDWVEKASSHDYVENTTSIEYTGNEHGSFDHVFALRYASISSAPISSAATVPPSAAAAAAAASSASSSKRLPPPPELLRSALFSEPADDAFPAPVECSSIPGACQYQQNVGIIVGRCGIFERVRMVFSPSPPATPPTSALEQI